ncbi:hypothetical protein AVEN_97215-1 [Araneus ventricosus]|uniref:Uncharacterized protein n=1 Tax=Araneus ventricosus TaxID=182803 RepID=A0A4Y2G999_ARAVE|nr:hypothetical protein AVEN_97215-1 [Araneus ventricosus]
MKDCLCTSRHKWCCDHFSNNRINPSDVSFTPERLCGSGTSKGTTGPDSDQKERIRGIGLMMNPRNRTRDESAETDSR